MSKASASTSPAKAPPIPPLSPQPLRPVYHRGAATSGGLEARLARHADQHLWRAAGHRRSRARRPSGRVHRQRRDRSGVADFHRHHRFHQLAVHWHRRARRPLRRSRRRRSTARSIRRFLTAVALSFLVMAPLGYLLSPSLLDLVNAAPEVKASALPFLRIMFLFSGGMLILLCSVARCARRATRGRRWSSASSWLR